MSKLSKDELIGILRRAGKLPGLRGWHEETVEQIVALIQKPQVTEEWIEGKAKEVWNLWWYKASGKYIADFTGTIRFDFQGVMNLIRSLVEKIK